MIDIKTLEPIKEQLFEAGVKQIKKDGTLVLKDGIIITPLDDPLEKSGGNEFVKAVADIVHTPEVKQAFKNAQPKKQKVISVEKEFERIEMIDGKAVLKRGVEMVDEPVFIRVPVEDEDGHPVMDGDKQVVHKVPVMEE